LEIPGFHPPTAADEDFTASLVEHRRNPPCRSPPILQLNKILRIRRHSVIRCTHKFDLFVLGIMIGIDRSSVNSSSVNAIAYSCIELQFISLLRMPAPMSE
jgi:hypothetical protein